MQKLPLWQPRPRALVSHEDLPLTPHRTQPALSTDLVPLFMDPHFEIFAAPAPDPWQKQARTVLYDLKHGRIWSYYAELLGCAVLEGEYYLLQVIEGDRVRVLRADADGLLKVLEAASRDALAQWEQQPAVKEDTELMPLKKIRPIIYTYKNGLYLASDEPSHEWEVASPVWSYLPYTGRWHQFTDLLTPNNKTLKRWVFPLSQQVICFDTDTIHYYNLTEGDSNDSVVLYRNKSGLLYIAKDTFVYAYDTGNSRVPYLLVLIKTHEQSRQPILLEFTLNQQQASKKNNPRAQPRVKMARLDLGVFVNTTARANRLWETINEITYMQLTQSTANTPTTGFMKKPQPKPTQRCLILSLYSKAIRTGSWSIHSPCIHLSTHSIALSQLRSISVDGGSTPLSYYFQQKQYCDLVLLVEKKEIQCSRQLFEQYSAKFKKLYSSHNSKADSQIIMKLDNSKFSAVYFLLQEMYHHLSIPVSDIDASTLVDLMVLAQKFQITELQALCQENIVFTCENFPRLYDYFRNAETIKFREELLKFFIIHAQSVIKLMPIGKVEELIRLVYSPECSHANTSEIRAKLDSTYSIRDPEGEEKVVSKCINYADIIKSEEVVLRVCLKCHQLLGFNPETHKKNKSSVRGSSLGSFGHKKKDNNSN